MKCSHPERIKGTLRIEGVDCGPICEIESYRNVVAIRGCFEVETVMPYAEEMQKKPGTTHQFVINRKDGDEPFKGIITTVMLSGKRRAFSIIEVLKQELPKGVMAIPSPPDLETIRRN